MKNFLVEVGKHGVTEEMLTPRGFREEMTEEQRYAVVKFAAEKLDDATQRALTSRIQYVGPVQDLRDDSLDYMKAATRKLNAMIGSGREREVYPTVDLNEKQLTEEEVVAMIRYEKAFSNMTFHSGESSWSSSFHSLDIHEDKGLSPGRVNAIKREAEKAAEKLQRENPMGADVFLRVHGRRF